MKIFTLTCDRCGTIVAANELEQRRVMKCPGLNCQSVLQFEDLAADEREHFFENRNEYSI
ncbi:hypothetical protein OB920_08335 [Halobacteria archaeon HArc-gm2]|nr:hypothetical protein [Halobacteria archaeon HArc-gm2]